MLSIGKLASGSSSADYYLKRQAGCQLDYYTGERERPGAWCGDGAAALGLSGPLTERGERALCRLLDGQSPTGNRLVATVLRLDPRARVPAEPVLTAIRAAAERTSGGRVEGVLPAARDLTVFERAAAAAERGRRRPAWPGPSIRVDDADRLLRVVGADPVEVLRGRRGRDRYTQAVRRLDGRVDVRVSGLDFTLSAPKSVSVLHALGGPEVAGEVRAAHGAAVEEALAYMQRQCARGLRGHHGAGRHTYVATDGLIGVAFEHRTSRENDPQLHTHVVVANLLRGRDGRWGAMDTREAYRQARTGGFVYQAVLRGQLSARLGVSWRPVRNGQAEMEHVPPGVLRVFSKRRAAITARLQATGRDSPAAAQMAALDTRPAKTGAAAPTLRARWSGELRDAGFDPSVLTAVLHRSEAPTVPPVGELADRILSSTGVTRDRSSGDRRDLLQAVCATLPAGSPVTLEELRGLATQVVRDQRVVPLLLDAELTDRRYTTAELLATEAGAHDDATRRAGDGLARVAPQVSDAAIGAVALSAEQAAMVRQLTSSGAGVEVVVGPAGSGKTAALAAARTAWQAGGFPVTGTALAAIAARVLEHGAGIPSSSLTRLLTTVHRVNPTTGESTGLPAGGVLIVDEAGMLGTRALAGLIRLTETYRTKLVLVGDPHQLPEIEAGGLFASLAATSPAYRLTGNQRQQQPWEREALTQLRHGDVLSAVEAYRAHDRLRVAGTPAELTEQVIEDYRTVRSAARPGETLIVTGSRADARRLNCSIRQALIDAGDLPDAELTVTLHSGGQRGFRVGDDVLVTANDYPRALLNGSRGQVRVIDPVAGSLTVTVSDGRDVTLPEPYLATGSLTHGYALTCHRAQGITVETALLWGSATLTRESGYVAMSRGRTANYVYLTYDGLRHDLGADIDRPRQPTPSLSERRDLAQAALVERLESSTRQRLASSWARRRDPRPTRRPVGRTARNPRDTR